MKNGKNIWTNGSETVKSETYPGKYVNEWYPCYAESRVKGSKYTPYDGSSEWVKAANRAMANTARGNFEKRGR